MRKFCASFKLPWKHRGETKRYYFLLVGSIFIIGFIGFITLQLNIHRVLAWYNSSWSYRQPITLTNNTGSSQTNYQYLLKVNTATLVSAGKLQSNCNDLRFTDSSNNLLSYYIDSGCNSSTSNIWVYITSLPTGNSTVYMYYGNASAVAGSSSTNFDNLVNLIDYYTFNDGSGSSAIDSSVNGNNGTLSNSIGTVSHVQNIKSITASSLTTSATFSSAITSGDLLICAVRFSGTPPTNAVTDNVNGNWTEWTAASNTGNNNYIYYVLHSSAASAGSMTVTVNAGTSGTNRQSCDDFTGASSWSLDTASNTSSGSSTSWGSPTYNGATTITPGASGELLYTGAGSGDSSDTITAGASGGISLTIGGQINTNGTIFSEYAITAASGAQYATATSSTTDGASFNGGIGFISYTPNTYTPTWGSGKYGNDLSFSGANAEDVSFTTALTSYSNYTIEAWVKPGNTNQDGMFFYNEYGGIGLGLNGPGGNDTTGDYLCGLYEAVAWMCTTSTLPSTSTWYHVVIQRGGGTTTIYLNGTSVGTFSSTPTYTNTGSTIGSAVGGGRPFNGQVDDVKFYSNTRTSTQISNDYSTAYTIATAGVGSTGVNQSFGSEQAYQSSLYILYWKFDDGSGTSAADSTNSGNTGTLAGGILPTWQTQDQCVYGKCLYFNGTTLSGGYVGISSSVNNIESISFWIKPISTSANDSLVNFGAYNEYISISSGNIITDGITSPTIYVNGKQTTSVTPDIWQQVVVTTSTPISATNFNVGSITTKVVSTIATSYYQGYMDDVKLLNYVLTPVQVLSDFNGPGTLGGTSLSVGIPNNNNYKVLNNNLVGYWKMDEPVDSWSDSTSEVIDSSGNGNNGTGGGYTGVSSPVAGKFNNSGVFNGTSQYVTIGNPSNLQMSGSFTLSAWVNVNNYTNYNEIIAKSDSSGANRAYELRVDQTTGYPAFLVYAGASCTTYYTSNNTSLGTGSWHQIIGVYNATNSTIQLFVDGKLVSSNTTVSGSVCSSNGSVSLGALGADTSATSDLFNGMMDDVRVYSQILSPDDVQTLYNFTPIPTYQMPVSSPQSGLALYYSYEEGGGSTVYDESGNNHNGVWSGTGTHYEYSTRYGYSANLNTSTSDSIAAPIPTSQQNNVTLEEWVYWGASSQLTPIIYNGATGANGYGLFIGNSLLNGNGNHICILLGGMHTLDTGYVMPSNEWVFLTATETSGNVWTVYVNGQSVYSGSYTTPWTPTGDFYIGTGSFTGMVDQSKLYTRVISQTQIMTDMNSGYPMPWRNGPVGKPIGYWKFDEGYGIIANNSGTASAALNGSLSNVTWSENGKYGKALSFNGTNSVVTTNTSMAQIYLQPSTITVSAWVNFSSLSGNQVIAQKYNTSSGASYSLDIGWAHANSLEFASYNTSTSTYYYASIPVSTLSTNKWYYVAGTYDGNSINLYINGQLRSSASMPSIDYSQSFGFDIGQFGSGGSVMNGLIDEVKVFGSALDSSQIMVDYNHSQAFSLSNLSDSANGGSSAAAVYCVPGDTATCSPPVGEWNFSEGQGTSVNDTSGNGNTGTWCIGCGINHWSYGKVGWAGNFNGTSDYVNIPDSSSLDMSGAISFNAWVRPAIVPSGSSYSFIGKKTNGTNNQYALLIDGPDCSSTARFAFAIWTGGSQKIICAINTNITANTWYDLEGTYDGSNIKIYINGKLDNTAAQTGSIDTNTGPLQIGRNDTSGSYLYWNGQVEQVRLFNYARTPAQVAWDYNKGGPVGWWKFDECTGSIAHDSSVNNNSATIYPGTQTLGNCSTSSTLWGNGVSGKINSSFYGDGSSSYVDIPNKAYLFSSTYTLSAWVNFSGWYAGSCLGNMILAAGSDNTSDWSYEMNVQDTGFCGSPTGNERVKYVQYFTDASTTTVYSTSYLSLNKWYLITLSYDGSKMDIYLNGVLNASSSVAKTPYVSTNDITIGKMNDSSYPFWVNGKIDDVRIYNYPLTTLQIQTLYNNGFAFFDGPALGIP